MIDIQIDNLTAALRRMFDAKSFLVDNFRTPAELGAYLRAYGIDPPSDNTIYQWFRRDSLPVGWGFLLAGLLEMERGAPVLHKYLRLPDDAR